MPDTVWTDPTQAYPLGLDRGTLQNIPSVLWDQLISNLNRLGGVDGATATGRRGLAKGADIVSAATVNLAVATGNLIHITGATGPITSFGVCPAGTPMWLVFDSTPTVTYNAVSMILAGGVNLVATAGLVLKMISEGAGNWREDGRSTIGLPSAGANGTVLTADSSQASGMRWQQPPLVNRAINPGFEYWQRGAGPFTATLAYSSDRHQNVLAGTDTLQIDREATTKQPNSLYAAKATFVLGSGAGATRYRQQLSINANEPNHDLLGVAISYAIEVKENTAVATCVRAFIETDGTGGTTTFSSYHGTNTNWETLKVENVTVPTDATYIRFGLALAATITLFADNERLHPSAVAQSYIGLTPAEDLARCLRFYEIHGAASTSLYTYGWAGGAGTQLTVSSRFAARKAVAPTVTRVGTWNVTNCDQPTVIGAGVDGYSLYVSGTGVGNMTFNSPGGAVLVSAEANP